MFCVYLGPENFKFSNPNSQDSGTPIGETRQNKTWICLFDAWTKYIQLPNSGENFVVYHGRIRKKITKKTIPRKWKIPHTSLIYTAKDLSLLKKMPRASGLCGVETKKGGTAHGTVEVATGS